MRVSAIMAAYNAERYVAEALDSVLTQKRRADEIIVVEDGSTDRTGDALRPFERHITLIRQPNGGPGQALNVAIAAATGDLFAFIDADDMWTPQKLEMQEAAIAELTIEAVFGGIRQFVSPDVDPEAASQFVVPEAPQAGICKTAMMTRRAAFDRIGPFDEARTAADFFDWYARATALGLRYHIVPEVVALRRQHGDNIGRRSRERQHDEIMQALKRSLDMRRARSKP